MLTKQCLQKESYKTLPRNSIPRWSCCFGEGHDREAKLSGFFLQLSELLSSKLLVVGSFALIDVFLSEAQHSVKEQGEFVGHGCDGFGRSEFGSEAPELRSQIAFAVAQGECSHAKGGGCSVDN